MGGLVIPLVAARRPVRRLVFLAAFLPSPGQSANDQRALEAIDSRVAPTTAEWTDLGDDVWMVGPNTATEIFFHDAPAPIAAWATARLRPQAYRVVREVTPLEAWPDVERQSIACRDDRAINPDWVRTAARERLGIEAIEIDGGHSPFLTARANLPRSSTRSRDIQRRPDGGDGTLPAQSAMRRSIRRSGTNQSAATNAKIPTDTHGATIAIGIEIA